MIDRRVLRAFLAAWLIAPIPFAIVNEVTQYVPPRWPTWSLPVDLLVLYGIGLLYGLVAIGAVGAVSAFVFERRDITGLGPHLLVGVVAGALPWLVAGYSPIAILSVPFAVFGAWIYWRVRYRTPAEA